MNPVTKIIEAVAEYNAYHGTTLSPREVIERVFSNLIPPKEEPRCTCLDNQKQRPLCPICDKEKYDYMVKMRQGVRCVIKQGK